MHPIFSLLLMSFSLYGVTLALVLFTKKAALRKANIFLGFLTLIFSIILFHGAISGVERIEIPFKYLILIGVFWYMMPPVIYMHARFTLYPGKKIGIRDGAHLVFTLLYLLNILPFFLLLNPEQQMEWQSASNGRSDLLYKLIATDVLLLFQYLIYLPLSFFTINKFLREKEKDLIQTSKRRVVFLRNAYLSLIIFIVLMETFRLFQVQGNWTYIFLLGIMFTISFLAYSTLYNPANIFEGIQFHSKLTQDLSKEQVEYFSQILSQKMQNGAFRDPNLTLSALAEEVKLKPRQLTKLIKVSYNMSFSEFVNEYRVNAITKMLTDKAYGHWTIMAIGAEVGFNSKTTFNRVFKQKTGLTPSQYIAQNQEHKAKDGMEKP